MSAQVIFLPDRRKAIERTRSEQLSLARSAWMEALVLPEKDPDESERQYHYRLARLSLEHYRRFPGA